MNEIDTLKELQALLPGGSIRIFRKASIKKFQHPDQHAVYVICSDNGKLLYIGQTRNLSQRFATMHNLWIGPNFLIYCLFFDSKKNACNIEKALIVKLKPSQNRLKIFFEMTGDRIEEILGKAPELEENKQ